MSEVIFHCLYGRLTIVYNINDSVTRSRLESARLADVAWLHESSGMSLVLHSNLTGGEGQRFCIVVDTTTHLISDLLSRRGERQGATEVITFVVHCVEMVSVKLVGVVKRL